MKTHLWFALVLVSSLALADAPLVVDGNPMAVIVTADHPGEVARYAAQEFAHHVEKATGVKLSIVTETAAPKDIPGRVFIGDCQAIRDAGIEVGKLPEEAFALRTKGQSLMIAGDDSGGDPLEASTRAGTLWGVYEWLEKELHARWLWPGELGTYVPKATSVVAHEISETTPPRFFQRKLRPGLGFTSEHPALGFTEAAAEQFKQDEMVFLRRHRMGRSFPFGHGHAFVDWWKKDGKAHPEWFQLRDNGQRGPSKAGGRFSMCVSNPGLQREIVARWAARRGGGSGAPSFLNACENDILGLCTCEQCRALDGPAPADYLKFYSATSKMVGARFVSDRYAHFWLSLQELAAQTDPEASVVGYVYFNYFQAPVTGIRLNPHILLGFCPSSGFFPRSEEEQAWMKRQWSGWHDTGARLFMRTNHLLDGYCMPFIFAHQFADEFHHAASEGMVATDYDSLTGHWGTQGPNLYVAARLHTRPEASADELLAEYYAAFGAAAPLVKSYFDYWEAYTSEHREQIKKTMEEMKASRWHSWAVAAGALYPPTCFPPAETLLARAAQVAAADPESAARTHFLQLGLDHAKLCARISAKLTIAAPAATQEEAKALLAELIAFRRQTEKSGISNFNHLAWMEDSSWKLTDETRKTPDLYP